MSEPSKNATRRTAGAHTRGRSERVVEAVLAAAVEEVGRVGYDALRMDEVARRSGVNKTTVYRRWPTKRELIVSALGRLADRPIAVDTGSVRDDLIAAIRGLCEMVHTPTGQGVLRLFHADRTEPDLEPVLRAFRESRQRERTAILLRAVARGELPPLEHPALIAELLFAPAVNRVALLGHPVDLEFITTIVDTVLAGIRAVRGQGATAVPASAEGR